MKKYVLFTVLCVFSFLCMTSLRALEGYTTESDIYVRSSSTKYSSSVGYINDAYTTLDLVSSELYNVGDPDCSAGWYKINYNGTVGYICGLYVSVGAPSQSNPDYSTNPTEVIIHGLNIYVRPNPSNAYGPTIRLMAGTPVIIKSEKIPGSGCQDGYYLVNYHKTGSGYVCAEYVINRNDLKDYDSEYEEVLKEKGFPSSYIPYLVKLHKLHPNWNFNAVKSNYTWAQVIDKENERNYIENVYITDEIKDLYVVRPSNEPNWSVATKGVYAYYIDPRNFLSEKFIFMFEKLDYNYRSDSKTEFSKDSESTKFYYDLLKKILAGSYLEDDHYVYTFIEAGFTYNVSPTHLASRAIQEGAGNPNYESVSGTSGLWYYGTSLNGYYNFYNIHATPGNGFGSITNGLLYACGPNCGVYDESYLKPWDTKEKAIKGGAYWISDGYINVGQSTLYYQKYNTTPNYVGGSNPFAHQYQTNLHAPASEGIDVFNSYKNAGQIDNYMEFDIPVYDGMPEEQVSLPTIASTINTLEEIKVNDTLVYGFDKDVIEYTVYVKSDLDKVNITVKKTDNLSKVTGDGEVTLTGDETTHKITVTAENGLVKEYTLIIKKAEDTETLDEVLSNLSTKQNGDVMYNISPETAVSTLVNSIKKVSSTIEVKITNQDSSIASSTDLLKTGQKITLVTSSGETRSYTLAVIGDTSKDGKSNLTDLLQIQKHILGTSTLDNERAKAADINEDGKINLTDLLRVQKYILGTITL